MSKGKFERKKPHVNVGTIGHVDHGKTTLLVALTKVLAVKFGGVFLVFVLFVVVLVVCVCGFFISTAHVEYESANRHFVFVVCLGLADNVKFMITGVAQMVGAILVCLAVVLS